MNYRIEKKNALVLTGYKKRFTGVPGERKAQDHYFTVETRPNQAILQYMAHDVDTSYAVFTNFDDEGYDYYIASYIGEESSKTFEEEMGTEIYSRFEKITIPEATYLVCESERCMWPCDNVDELYRKAVNEWLPSSEYELAEGPEVEVIHWYYKENDDALNSSRYTELWLPIVKK